MIKIDAEGSEYKILNAIDFNKIQNCVFFIEISNMESRNRIWELSCLKKLNLKSQKIGWKKPSNSSELPDSWRDGSIEISI